MSRDPACLFCRLVAGEVPSARILETDRAVAFLDLHPVNKGHVLLAPKAHHASLADVPEDLAAHLGGLLPRVVRAVRSVTGAAGLNAIANVGEVAGQTIPHLHLHLIPRFEGDDFQWPWPHQSYEGREMETIRSRLEEILKSTIS